MQTQVDYSVRLLPLVKWLHGVYGTWSTVGEVVGIDQNILDDILHGHPTTPQIANKVVQFVLEHKRRSYDLFSTYEEPVQPRFPTLFERDSREAELKLLKTERRRYGY